jgi:DNA-binding CsgD family transcriptional regulator
MAKAVSRGADEFPLDPSEYLTHQSVPVGEPYAVEGVEGPVQDYHVGPVELVDPIALLKWFNTLQTDFPMIRIRQVGSWPQEARQRVKATASHHREMAESAERLTREGQTLHLALDAFRDWHAENYRTLEGVPTQHAVVCQKQIETIKAHAKDMHLEAFGLKELDGLIRYWSQRPMSKRGRPVSKDTAQNHIKRIRAFVRWLHRNADFNWRKPEDYEVGHIRITSSTAERKRSPHQVLTYNVEELAVVWKYASPKERVLIVLALNCGFGRMELSTLQTHELYLSQPHGVYDVSGSFVKAIRNKSSVYGEWKLWPETEAAINWFLAQRPVTTETALLVTKHGKPLNGVTKSNNYSSRVPNIWTKLLQRIQKDIPGFRVLSFNKLRKTAANLVRKAGDGEIAAVFLCHGQSVKSDDLNDIYTNRPFDKVFQTLDAVRTVLAPVFTVPDPFAATARRRNPSLTLAVRERIVALRREGKSYNEIVCACGVAIDTVRRYLTAAGLVRKYKTSK